MKMAYKIEKQKLNLAIRAKLGQFVHSQKMDRDNLKLKLSKLEIPKQMLDVELQTNKTHEKHGTSF